MFFFIPDQMLKSVESKRQLPFVWWGYHFEDFRID